MSNTKKISTEEIYMKAYFNELKEAGFIKEIIYQPTPIVLLHKVEVPVKLVKQLKTKFKEETKLKIILKDREYTMDFQIIWNGPSIFHKSIQDDYYEQKLPLFFSDMNRTYVEVKSDSRFDHNTTRFFLSRTQPWIWEKFNMYINLIKVPDIFKESFIPQEILHNFYYKRKTKKNKIGDAKYSWKYRTLKEFTDEINR